ncbi:glycosyltransferase family 4 protein [Kordia sp. YSTF-M3]|uniref:Glycosyltransferase family 4 protein n=1 Tax=Kordia aestuariivivens TaxID=2759037 RepID=A0ABR7QBZ8_9FLAO|nr:glycosyltransferase [Kordia aestuariivivens]MBC8755918.1 glycosyltransferase family 4 protein [Kordia aestuariivivens]
MQQHVLVIGYVWPEPKSSAAGTRMLQLLQLFRANDWEVTFACPAAKSEFIFDLRQIDIAVKTIQINDASFDKFIKKLNPSIVLFDRFMMEEQFGWRVAENCPAALRILDTEDLHSLRKARHQALKDGKEFHIDQLKNYQLAQREIASVLRCDISLLISEVEHNLLVNEFKIDTELLLYLPFMLEAPSKAQIEALPSFEERHHFVTIGNFLHAPNRDMVLYLKKEVWTILRKKFPKAEMHIYGSYAKENSLQLNQPKEKFFVHGRAESASEVISKARILLAPLRFGAGLKGKFIDGMQNGTPCATTTIGAEGMHGNLPWNGIVSDDIETLVDEAIALYTDKNSWLQAQQNGFEILAKRYPKEIFQQQLLEKIQIILKNLETHRTQNFMGSLLQLHTTNSTKYMSKWIEEKNRK